MPDKKWRMLGALLTLTGLVLSSLQASAATTSPSSDPGEWTIQSEIALDRYPPGIALDSDSLWILQAKMLHRVALATGKTTARIALDCKPHRVVTVSGAILVACEYNKVLVIDPASLEVTHSLRVKGQVIELTRGGGFLWILHPLGKVSRLDPDNLEEVHTLKIAGKGSSVNHNGLAYLNDTLWILNSKKGNLIGVDAISGEVTHGPLDLEKGAVRIVADLESLWIVNMLQSRASLFDPGSEQTTTHIPVGEAPTDGAFFENAIWIACANGRSLTRIELGTHTTTTHRLPARSRPVAVQAANGALWLSTIDDYRVLELRPAKTERISTGGQIRSATGPRCMSGPQYKKEMLERKCDSVPALARSPVGRVVAIAAMAEDMWLIAGSSNSPSSSLFLLRTDGAGNVELDVRFGQGHETRLVDVVTLDQGDAMVAADIRDVKESPWETLLARIDSHDGSLLWERRYPTTTGSSRLVSQIVTLPAGGLAMGGSLLSNSPSLDRHAFLARIDPDGEVVWETEIAELEGIDRLAVSVTEVAAVGPPRGQVSMRFLRLDFSGMRLGSVTATSENYQATDLVSMADGGWSVVGDPGVWAGRGLLLRLDPLGEPLWCRYLGSGDAYRWGWRLLPQQDGSLLAAGTPRYYVSLSGPKGFLNLVRVSADGELIGEHLYKG